MTGAYLQRSIAYSRTGDNERGEEDDKKAAALAGNMDTTGAVGELMKARCR